MWFNVVLNQPISDDSVFHMYEGRGHGVLFVIMKNGKLILRQLFALMLVTALRQPVGG